MRLGRVGGKRWNKYVKSHDLCVWCQRSPKQAAKDNLSKDRKAMTVDHLWPKGTHQRKVFAEHSTVAACYRCNHKRGGTSLLMFLAQGYPRMVGK
jgi:hypothetical protein